MTEQLLSIDVLREAVGKLPDDGLMPVRIAALEAFARKGLPTPRDEDWKYTNIAPALQALVDAPVPAGSGDAGESVMGKIDADWLIIANGRAINADAVKIGGADVALLSDSDVVLDSDVSMTQLNTALLHDGIRIRVSEGTGAARPIGLLFIDDASGMSQGRVEIAMEADSQLSFIEYHLSLGAERHHSNSVVTLRMGDGAHVDYVRIQDRDRRHSQTGRLDVIAGRDSTFNHCGFDFGGALVRNDLGISIVEPGASISFDGLYLAGKDQHIDNHTRVDHKVGPAASRQEYRGILNGNARCIWNGKAVVHPGADGTDADQSNHNLLLSDKAEIDAKPELEIYADDVKCSHGTTVGQLDETSLYYLRTRGLDKQLAQQLLTQAFAQSIVSRVPVPAVGELVSSMIDERLERLLGGIEQ